MSSSISGSDDASAWGRCLAACLGTLALCAALIFAVMIAVDPYDSGRFGLLGIKGVSDANPRIANASRARDLQFDAAVIGDSTAIPLSPTQLSQKAGMRFVKLTAYGFDPREQLATLDFYIRQHSRIGALVVVTNMPWCARAPLPALREAFPFWLYDGSAPDYAARLFSWRALEHVAQRIMIGLGSRTRENPDGHVDYEEIWPPGEFRDTDIPREMVPTVAGKADDAFPFIMRLGTALEKLPADAPLVLVMPPTFRTLVPQPGSVAAAENEACAGALKRLVERRARGNFIDFRVDNALTRDPANFADVIHYRAKIARKMEDGIAASIRLGKDAKIDF
ncbi:MAG: hypothetical protein JWQ17_6297 [Tardiphaga sp.]|nr:hypothetical protein [Tardiphaga sp.]